MAKERTYIMLKPDGVKRKLIGEVKLKELINKISEIENLHLLPGMKCRFLGNDVN